MNSCSVGWGYPSAKSFRENTKYPCTGFFKLPLVLAQMSSQVTLIPLTVKSELKTKTAFKEIKLLKYLPV